jgi:hypothetical protein
VTITAIDEIGEAERCTRFQHARRRCRTVLCKLLTGNHADRLRHLRGLILVVRKQGESAKANDHKRRCRPKRRKLRVPLGETTPPITQHRFLLILSAVRDRGRKLYAF